MSFIRVSESDLPEKKERMSWPFSTMALGEIVAYSKTKDKDTADKAQKTCHVIGRYNGMRFETQSGELAGDQVVFIKRIK